MKEEKYKDIKEISSKYWRREMINPKKWNKIWMEKIMNNGIAQKIDRETLRKVLESVNASEESIQEALKRLDEAYATSFSENPEKPSSNHCN